jgi:uncharacterized protein YegL
LQEKQKASKDFFFKKRSKKLLLAWAIAVKRPVAQINKVFSGNHLFFLQKGGSFRKINSWMPASAGMTRLGALPYDTRCQPSLA